MNLQINDKNFISLTEFDFIYPTRTIMLNLGKDSVNEIESILQSYSNNTVDNNLLIQKILEIDGTSLMTLFNHKYYEFFNFKSDELNVKLFTQNYNEFILERNSKQVILNYTQDMKHGIHLPFFVFIGWTPTSLSINLVDTEGKKIIDKYGSNDSDLFRDNTVNKTSRTNFLEPSTLLNEILTKQKNYNEPYESIEKFNQKVISIFEELKAKIDKVGSPVFAWDGSIPKNETKIQPTIETLLYDSCVKNQIILHREASAGSGSVDFVLSAFVSGKGITNICVEIKKAHSKNIYNGLLKQLPTYMNSKSSKYGIYCVLWFKGKEFKEPTKYEQYSDLDSELKHYRYIQTGEHTSKITIITIDLSLNTAPSKL